METKLIEKDFHGYKCKEVVTFEISRIFTWHSQKIFELLQCLLRVQKDCFSLLMLGLSKFKILSKIPFDKGFLCYSSDETDA